MTEGQTATQVWTVLAAAFGASILTMLGARWVAGFQAKRAATQEELRRAHEREQARVADERSLRDAKRERLRGDYVAVAIAADTILGVSKELGVIWAEETQETRDDRLRDRLEAATKDLERAMVRLMLEEGTLSVLFAYQGVRSLWFTYQYQMPEADRKHDHREVAETLKKIESEVEGIIGTAKAHLDSLGKPI